MDVEDLKEPKGSCYKKDRRFYQRLGRSPDFHVHGLVFWPFIFYHVFICTHSLPMRLLYFCIGAFVQSFVEYVSHAWFFHGPLWEMHRGHHKRPGDDAKLIVPLAFSLPWVFVLYTGVGSFVTPNTLAALTVGSATWYMLFEYIHFASHCPQCLKTFQRIPWFKTLQGSHKLHHFDEQGGQYKYYGFTTTFWDHVFGTV